MEIMDIILLILLGVIALAVLVSWASVITLGFSKHRGMTHEPLPSGVWSQLLLALFYLLGGGFIIPAALFAVWAFQEPRSLGLLWASLVFCLVFGLWLYAAKRLGLWQLVRAIFGKVSALANPK